LPGCPADLVTDETLRLQLWFYIEKENIHA
jgi:hypothetical protein